MFEYLVNVMPQLISGTGITVKLFALTLIGSIPLGILLAFVLASRLRILKLIVQVYVWLMRGTPLLLQLIFVFYGLPILGIVFDRFEAALIAFIINYAAYFCRDFSWRDPIDSSRTIRSRESLAFVPDPNDPKNHHPTSRQDHPAICRQ